MKRLYLLICIVLASSSCSHNTQAGGPTSMVTAQPSSTSVSTTPTSLIPTSLSTVPSGPRSCTHGNLSVSLQHALGAAGTIERTVTFTNSSVTCTLYGYPGMQLLDQHSRPIQTTVIRGGVPGNSTPVTTVTIANGQQASFVYSYSDVPSGTETTCPVSAYAEITPPNDSGYIVVSLVAGPCDNGTLHVSPVFFGS